MSEPLFTNNPTQPLTELPSLDTVIKPPTPSPEQLLTAPAEAAVKPQVSPQAYKRQLPVNRRRFGDVNMISKLIYKNVLDHASNIAPEENSRHILRLSNLQYVDPEQISLSKQKEAILGNKTLYRRLKGTWQLLDKASGQVLDERNMTVAQVPHMTERGTFVINGTEYTLAHQMRLRPGIFTRIKANNEVEAHVNVIPGQGVSHRYFFEPDTSVFKINVGQSKVPLFPILRAMGVSDKKIQEAWGPEIFAINKQLDSPHVVDKLYQRMVRRADMSAPAETKSQALSNELQKMKLDPEVTKRTLGKPYDSLTPDAILDTTKKLLAVNRRESEIDDRDHLAFQHLMGPEDLIAERIGKDRTTLRNLLWYATNKGNLEHVQPGAFTKSIMAAFISSGLGQAAEEVNAAELVDHQGRITRLGEGGIGSVQAVPAECYDEKTQVFTSEGWKLFKDINSGTKLACLIDGRLEYHKPIRLMQYDYDGLMYGARTKFIDYLVTPEHEMWCVDYDKANAVWRKEYARNIHGKYKQFQVSHKPYKGNDEITAFTPPEVGGARIVYRDIRIDDWAELVGWMITEGNIDKYALKHKNVYKMSISQDSKRNPDKVERIDALLTRLKIHHSYRGHNFSFASKQLGTYFQALGSYAHEKALPEEVFEWPVSARERLLEVMIAGDGHTYSHGGRVFHSSSAKLVEQVVRLAVSLGKAVSECKKPRTYNKKEHRDSYSCYITTKNLTGITRKAQLSAYSTVEYKGPVYCAEVPGNLLLVRRSKTIAMWSGNSRNVHSSQMAFIDMLKSPESFKAGVDLRTAYGVQKGTDGRMYAPFIDLKRPNRQGYVYKSPQELADLVVTFPGEMDSNKPYVQAMNKGKLGYVSRDKVDLSMPSMENAFSPLSNMVPMKSAVKGQRVSMGARMLSQALPLLNAQAPLVQSAVPGVGTPDQPLSYEWLYGKSMGSVLAEKGGVVLESDNDGIKVRHDDGTEHTYELYNHHPYNRKTFLHNTNFMKPGDRFAEGDLLAKSNYTDNSGTAALGLNARVAYLPFQGKNYEDAIVISDSMAKRMTSEHMYQHVAEFDAAHKGKNSFISLFPGKYDKKTLETMDENGVVKPGTVVKYGDPLVLIAQEKERAHNQVHRGKTPFSDNTITWDHHTDGLVTDVMHSKGKALVAVKSYMPMQVGDKLSGRYGDKGVVSEIVPDHNMPHDSQGRPFEILLSPMGLISRINAAQAVEAALGKIAEKTGKPYVVEDFKQENLVQYALDELKKNNLEDLETVTDPTTGRQIPGVLSGNRFFMKLHHTSASKSQGRGAGGGYSVEGVPTKGGEAGSKRVSLMDSNALLAHGATEVLKDAHVVRGQKNEDYWLQFMAGHTPPEPKVPFVYEKFINELKGAGINVVRDGHKLQVMALTDKDIQKMTEGRELQNVKTVDWKGGLKPVKGGLFDPGITGGHGGNRWAKITLHEPMPNPAMEEPIRKVLGLTEAHFLDILSGKQELNGKKGPDAIHTALKSINLDKEIGRAKAEIASGRKSLRDAAVRRLQYLESAKKLNIHPGDWVVNSVPVLPPTFRPVSLMSGRNGQVVSDPNYLYKEVWDANDNLANLSGKVDDLSEERLNVYNAFKAVTGLGDPIQPRNQEKSVKGILRHIFGCYDDATEILTKNGWAPIKDLADGVEVFTLNPDTGFGEWQMPSEVQHYRYVGQLIRLQQGRNFDLLLTPDHRNWVRKRAKHLSQDNMESGWEFEYAYQTAAFSGRQWFRTAPSGWAGHRDRPDFLPAGCQLEDFAEFVGWWLAEGFLGKDTHRNRVSICQSSKNATYCEQINRVVSSLGFKYRVSQINKPDGSHMKVWSITHEDLAAWIESNCGRGSAGKMLSTKLRDWDSDLLSRLWLGYLSGDGRRQERSGTAGGLTHRNNTKSVPFGGFSTVSEALCNALVEVGAKLGYTVRTRSVPPKNNRKRKWIGNISGSRFAITEGDYGKSVEHYDGYVHCCTVPNGIVYVRRNGKPVYSGNSSPKFSAVQFKLLGASVNLVGRGVIIPNPDMDMDSIGLPEEKAWEVYQPFVVRGLARRGMPRMAAIQAVKDKTKAAREVLLEAMQDRPVLVNRYPVLHRYGLMAFWPKLVKGETIHVSPLVTKAFAADFNGDSCLTPLSVIRIGDTLYSGSFEDFISRYVMNEYREDDAVNMFGCQTTVFEFDREADVKVISADKNGKVQWSKVNNISIHTSHGPDCFRVKTATGLDALFTAHHNFVVLNDKCELHETKTTEVREGDLIPYVADFDTEIKDLVVPYKTLTLNYDTGLWLGHYMADGAITGRGDTVSHASKDPVLLELLETIGSNFTDKKAWYEGNKYSVRWTDTQLVNVLDKWMNRGCEKKRVAGWMFAGPREFRLGLLVGYLLGEGNAQRTVRVECVNRNLLLDFKFLLSTLGVKSSVRDGKPARGNNQSTYVLNINLTGLKHLEGLSWPECEKSKQFVEAINNGSTERTTHDMVPFPSVISKFCLELGHKLKGGGGKELRSKLNRTSKPLENRVVKDCAARSKCTRHQAVRIIEGLNLEYFAAENKSLSNWIDIVKNPNLCWDEVESITVAERPAVTYDLSVEGSENFTVDGPFLTHNTMQYHVPTSDDAKRDAVEKMLPSRNLFSGATFKVHYLPNQEFIQGLHSASTAKDGYRPKKVYATTKDALAAYHRGDIGLGTPVEILER